TQEPPKPAFETPFRTVADKTKEKPVEKPAERVEANHEEEKISELPKVKMPTRSRKPLKDIPVADDLKEDEEPAQPVPKHAVVEYYTTNDEYPQPDRKSTRLNSSHVSISYAVFCLKKKKNSILTV